MTTDTSKSPMTLGTESISRLLVQYSVPAIIASVVTSLYNIIDSIFIGRGVGAMAISGLAITFPLMNLVIAFCTLIAVGGATISSIFMGQKDISRATDVVNNVLLLCIIQSVVFGGITLLFLDEIHARHRLSAQSDGFGSAVGRRQCNSGADLHILPRMGDTRCRTCHGYRTISGLRMGSRTFPVAP